MRISKLDVKTWAQLERVLSPEKSVVTNWKTLMSTGSLLVTQREDLFSRRMIKQLLQRLPKLKKLASVHLCALASNSSKEKMEQQMMSSRYNLMPLKTRLRIGPASLSLTSPSGPLAQARSQLPNKPKPPMNTSGRGSPITWARKFQAVLEFSMADQLMLRMLVTWLPRKISMDSLLVVHP